MSGFCKDMCSGSLESYSRRCEHGSDTVSQSCRRRSTFATEPAPTMDGWPCGLVHPPCCEFSLIFSLPFYGLSDFFVVSLCVPTVPCEACPWALVGPIIKNPSSVCHLAATPVKICFRSTSQIWSAGGYCPGPGSHDR